MTRTSPDESLGGGLKANGGALGIHMFEDGAGYWTGSEHAYLARTIDGGTTWVNVWRSDGRSELVSISWLDGIHACAIRWRSYFGPDLVVTSDGGKTWSSLERWPVRF